MPTIKKTKVGSVTLLSMESGRYECRWYDAQSRNTARRTFKAAVYKEALAIARNFDQHRLEGLGLLPSSRRGIDPENFPIGVVFEKSIRNTRASQRTRLQYANDANLFLEWLSSHYPVVKLWGDLKPHMIQEYVLYCEDEKLAFDTRRKRFFVLRKASLYMSENHDCKDITKKIRLIQDDKPQSPVAFTVEEVKTILEYARNKYVALYPILQLMACGLRIWEAAYLLERDIDINAGTIRIDESPYHKPKTRSGFRTLPIPSAVIDSLRTLLGSRKIQGADTLIFPSPRSPVRAWSITGISHALRKCFNKAARDTGISAFQEVEPRKMRASCATALTLAGCPEIFIKRYLGHAPDSILAKHYQAITVDDLRREVITRLENLFFAAELVNKNGGHHVAENEQQTYHN